MSSKKKAEFILLLNGANPVRDILDQEEGNLANREATAQKSKAEQQAELSRAEARLGQFESECREFISQLTNVDAEVADYKLAEDFCRRLENSKWIENCADTAARNIYHELVKPYFKTYHENRDEVLKVVNQIMVGVLQEGIRNEYDKWEGEIQLRENVAYEQHLNKRLLRIQEDINQKWQDARQGKDLTFLDKIELTQITGFFLRDLELWSTQVADAHLKPYYQSFDVCVNLLAVIRNFIRGIPDFINEWFGGGNPDIERCKTLRSKVMKSFNQEGFKAAMKNQAETAIRSIVKTIREHYAEALKEASDKPRQIFNQRRAEREEQLKLATADLAKVAKDACIKRTEQIEPLRKEVESYADHCRQVLSGVNPD